MRARLLSLPLSLFAFSSLAAADGARDPHYHPEVRKTGTFAAGAELGSGGWAVRGTFDFVNGFASSGLVHFRADGSIDPNFATAPGLRVLRAPLLADGGHLVLTPAGDGLTTFLRLTPTGAPDPNFTPYTVENSVSPNTTPAFVVEPSGRVHVLRTNGNLVRVERRLPNGLPDPSFVAPASQTGVSGLTLLSDGAVYVSGSFTSFGGVTTSRLARLQSNGPADPNFQVPVRSSTEGIDFEKLPMVAAPGGGLYVYEYGYYPIFPAPPFPQAVRRLLSSGADDPAFPTVELTATANFVSLRANSPGTRLVLAPYNEVEQVPPPATYTFRFLDLNAAGAVSSSYDVPVELGYGELPRVLAAGEKGDLFFDGSGDQGFRPGRYSPFLATATSVPRRFAPDLLAEVPGGAVTAVVAAPDGRALVLGQFSSLAGEPTPASAALYGSNGQRVPQFDAVMTAKPSRIDRALFDPQGGIILIGLLGKPGGGNTAILRLDANLAVDQTFLTATGAIGNVTALAFDAAGGLLIAGNLPGSVPLLRVLPSGSLDPAYNPAAHPGGAPPELIVPLPNGKVVLVYRNSSRSGLLQLLANGQVDPKFQAGSLDARSEGTVRERILAACAGADGRLAICYYPPLGPALPSYANLAKFSRLEGNGTPLAGYPRTPFVGISAPSELLRLRDGRLLAVGDFEALGGRRRLGLARLSAEGDVDHSFRAELPISVVPATLSLPQQLVIGLKSAVEMPDGSLLVVPRATGEGYLLRLTSAGLPFAPAAGKGHLVNLSARGKVQTGDGVMIGGLVVKGSGRRILFRTLGPSLSAFGVQDVLADPVLEIFSGSTSIAVNDDWSASSQAAEIQATGLAPTDTRESARLLTLPEGSYTMVVRGKNGGTGHALVEVYVLDSPDYDSAPPAPGQARAVNLSTRAVVGGTTGELIGGFAIRGGQTRVALRALGASLAGFGVSGPLSKTDVRVVRTLDNGTIGGSATFSDIPSSPLTFPPLQAGEFQTVLDLPEGNYTVVIAGKDGATGTALFEVYEVSE